MRVKEIFSRRHVNIVKASGLPEDDSSRTRNLPDGSAASLAVEVGSLILAGPDVGPSDVERGSQHGVPATASILWYYPFP